MPSYCKYETTCTGLFGSIEVSLGYEEQTSKLHVTIIRCKGLRSMDSNGLSDPYVNIFSVPGREMSEKQTEVHYKTLDPEFNESFVFEGILKDSLQDGQLCFVVMDCNEFSRDNFIGATRVNLYELLTAPSRSFMQRRLLDDRRVHVPQQRSEDTPNSKLQITTSYSTQLDSFIVNILRVKYSLPVTSCRLHHNLFIKCYLNCCGHRVKKKTKVFPKMINPEFNEELHFPMKLQNLPYCRMTVTILDHRKFKNYVVGKVITDWYDLKSSATRPDSTYITKSPLDLSLRKHAQRTIKRRQSRLTRSLSLPRSSKNSLVNFSIERNRSPSLTNYISESIF